MLFLDVEKHDSQCVFQRLVHFPPITAQAVLLPKAKCVHIYKRHLIC